MEQNNGISVGGNFVAGAVAAGKHARATNISTGESLDDARTRMQVLLDLLHTHAGELARPDETIAVAERARRELETDEPDKPTVLGWLTTVASGAGSIAAISGAVAAVQQAIAALL
ncbi:hypothetical protein AB0L70_29850 [Kribbella sp. NPDC051952]|uniref:hypothetical protein n=1 Tax=Kribbella sp. NPDC051952 TaxID=3154851 RepID=UPI00342C3F41